MTKVKTEERGGGGDSIKGQSDEVGRRKRGRKGDREGVLNLISIDN